jgi:quercetin dioxygenase-like cupin family protein
MVYSKEQGDHLLVFRGPLKFTKDVQAFLEGKEAIMDNIEHSTASEVILQSASAWNGTPYSTYPRGQPELTVLRITVPAHGELPWHTHPIPNAAYVVSGEITIEEQNGTKRRFSAGQAIAETVDTLHRGVVGDELAVFIVFYPGVVGMPISVPKP